MTTTLQKGDLAHVVITFRDSAGVLTDPDVAWFQWRDGANVWSDPVTPTRLSTGTFYHDFDTSTPDTKQVNEEWFARGYSPPGDSLQAADQVQFTVANPGRV